jgi:LysR family transcriptional regulator, nod-box dependent transcriptional activator
MNLSQFDLNLLVSLDALLIERNVTRAGQRVGLSQPAMSGTLSRLRDLFKDELLVRVGRQLELTPLAQELAPQLRQQLQGVEDLLNARRSFVPATEARTFSIAASDYVAFLLLQPLVARMAEQAPGIKLQFVRLDSTSVDRLGEDAVDFVVQPSYLQTHFPATELFTDRWVCVVWSGNQRVGRALTEAQYLSLPHLAFSMPNEGAGSAADVHLNQLGVHRRIAAWTESFILSPFLIRGTEMVTLVHERVARALEGAAEARIIAPPYDLPELKETLIWNPRRSADPPHLWMREQILAAAREIG